MNKVILLGRLTRDPEVRFSQSAEPMAICRFSVAVDRPYSSKRGEGEPTADFINCVCFGKRGETIGQYFHKGNRIAVIGRLQVSSWTDNNNQKRYSTDVIVDDFEFCENKSSSPSSSASNQPASSSSASEPDDFYSVDSSVDDDNLPF